MDAMPAARQALLPSGRLQTERPGARLIRSLRGAQQAFETCPATSQGCTRPCWCPAPTPSDVRERLATKKGVGRRRPPPFVCPEPNPV
jgi:hypothetical protein